MKDCDNKIDEQKYMQLSILSAFIFKIFEKWIFIFSGFTCAHWKINNNLLHINRLLLWHPNTKMPNNEMLLYLRFIAENSHGVVNERSTKANITFFFERFSSSAHTRRNMSSLSFPICFPSFHFAYGRCSVVCVTAMIFTKHFIANTTGFIHSRDSKETRLLSMETQWICLTRDF